MQQSEPSDHLLQILQAGAVGGRILDLSPRSVQARALEERGFDVIADPTIPGRLTHEDSSFEWVIALDTLSHLGSRDQIVDLLRECARVLKPAGRMYITARAVPDELTLRAHGYAGDSGLEPTFTPTTLAELALEAGLEEADGPVVVSVDNGRFVRAVFQNSEGA